MRTKIAPARCRAFMLVLAVSATAALALMTTGCYGAAASSWKKTDAGGNQKYTGKSGLSVDLPAGWMAREDKGARALLLTRHSVPMGFISIRQHPLSSPLPHTELTLNANMQPYELAEIIANNLRATPGVLDLMVEELAPGAVGGKDGFSLLMTYSMENGLNRRCLVFGTAHGGKYYTEIALYALEDYYFGAALSDFLGVAGSMKVK